MAGEQGQSLELEMQFYGMVDGQFDRDPDTIDAMAIAQDEKMRRIVQLLSRPFVPKFITDDSRALLMQYYAEQHGIAPDVCERGYKLCKWMLDEEAKHGQA